VRASVQKSDIEIGQDDLIDAVRTMIRLKHRRAQRRDLNDQEPAIVEAYQAAVSAGKPYEFGVKDALKLLGEGAK
jgi:hypothetical protein